MEFIALALALSLSPPPANRLPPVVVTATRVASDPLLVPAAVDVVAGDDLHRAQPSISLSEALRRIPGVVARERQNQAQDLQVSIRGFGARATFGVRGVRLLTDGIPASMPDGQGQVSHFALSAAGRIEVLRGPFSALHGNASGGVIELTSANAPADPEVEASLVAGSDALLGGALSWRGPLAGDALGARIDAGQVRGEGFRRHSVYQRSTGQALLRGEAGVSLSYALLVNSLRLDADDPQGLTAAELAGDRRAASPNALRFDARKTVRQDQVGSRFVYDASDRHQLALVLHAGARETFQMLTVPVAAQANPLNGGGALDLDRRYHGIDARWRWTAALAGRPLVLTLGVQDEVADEARRGFENFVGAQLGVLGALRRDEQNRVASVDQYLQADWQPTQHWRVNAGLRRSRVAFRSLDHFIRAGNPDDSGSLLFRNVAPVAGILYRASPWLSFYGNAGRGFETPTFAELAYRSDGNSGLNDSLRPARSANVEIGLRARRGALEYSAALFQARTRDELVVVANQGGRSVFDNAPLSRRRGLELAWSDRLAPDWQASANFTFLDAGYLRDFSVCATPPCAAGDLLIRSGRRIPGISRAAAWGELRWSPGAETDVALEGRASSRILADDANSAAAPGFASFDLSIERRMQLGDLQWRGFARLNNLADRAVVGSVIVNEANGRYFEPAPGRHWVLGLSATRRFD